MFTRSADVKKFLEPLKEREASEVIIAADREATEAFRRGMRCRREASPDAMDWCEYSNRMKDVITVLRYDTAPNPFDLETRKLLRAIKKRSIRIIAS